MESRYWEDYSGERTRGCEGAEETFGHDVGGGAEATIMRGNNYDCLLLRNLEMGARYNQA